MDEIENEVIPEQKKPSRNPHLYDDIEEEEEISASKIKRKRKRNKKLK